jgi:hypothetical protein
VNCPGVVAEAVSIFGQVSHLVSDWAVDEEGTEEEAGAVEASLGAAGYGVFIYEELAGAG